MTDLEFSGHLSEARKHMSAASYDVQRLPQDSVERQALHNLVMAVDEVLAALSETADEN